MQFPFRLYTDKTTSEFKRILVLRILDDNVNSIDLHFYVSIRLPAAAASDSVGRKINVTFKYVFVFDHLAFAIKLLFSIVVQDYDINNYNCIPAIKFIGFLTTK